MRFCILRSGSSGNCTLLEHNNCRILIDAGMSQKRIREVLEEAGTTPEGISAIVITHLHSDHFNYSTLQVCRKYGIPLWINTQNVVPFREVFRKYQSANLNVNSFSDEAFRIGTTYIAAL